MEFLIVYLVIGFLEAVLIFGVSYSEYSNISKWNIAWLMLAFFIGYPIIILIVDITIISRIINHKLKNEPKEISNIDNLTEDSSAKI